MRRTLTTAAVLAALISAPAAADGRHCAAEHAQVKAQLGLVVHDQDMVSTWGRLFRHAQRAAVVDTGSVYTLRHKVAYWSRKVALAERGLGRFCRGAQAADRWACMGKRARLASAQRASAFFVGALGDAEVLLAADSAQVSAEAAGLASWQAQLASDEAAVQQAADALRACQAAT